MNFADLWLLLDTSIKVALGSGITLLALWLSKRAWWQSPSQQMAPNRRRLELLEQISTSVGNVNHCFAKYSALVIESTRFGSNWPAARRTELERINSELVHEFQKLAHAEATLLMLGEKTMEQTLRLYGAKIALFRKQVYVGRQDISEQEIADLKTAVRVLREQFYDLLSRRYDRLLVA